MWDDMPLKTDEEYQRELRKALEGSLAGWNFNQYMTLTMIAAIYVVMIVFDVGGEDSVSYLIAISVLILVWTAFGVCKVLFGAMNLATFTVKYFAKKRSASD